MRRSLARLLAALTILGAGPAAGYSSPLSVPDVRGSAAAPATRPVGWAEVRVTPDGLGNARSVDVLVWYPARELGPVEPYSNTVPGLGPGGADLVIQTPASASRRAKATIGNTRRTWTPRTRTRAAG